MTEVMIYTDRSNITLNRARKLCRHILHVKNRGLTPNAREFLYNPQPNPLITIEINDHWAGFYNDAVQYIEDTSFERELDEEEPHKYLPAKKFCQLVDTIIGENTA